VAAWLEVATSTRAIDHSEAPLFGLEGFRVVSVSCEHEHDEKHDGVRQVVVEGVEDEQAGPDCGALSGAVHGRKLRPVKDLPHGRAPLKLWWDQRRWACRERACRRRTVAETSGQIGAGNRLTLRLREHLERSVSTSTRSAADVARENGVSWWSVNHALVVKAASMTPQAPGGVRLLGIDETRPMDDQLRRPRPDPPGWDLGLGAGPLRHERAWVACRLALQSSEFRDGIEVVAVDPSAPFAAALREVLPHATLVVDHWHLHRLANLMVTQVRQRVTQQVHGHRGRASNDSWAYRQLLLRGARHLSDKQWKRLKVLFATDDPTGQLQAAWAAKECLRQLLDALPATDGPLVTDPRRDPGVHGPALRPYQIRARLRRFYDLAAVADIPELTRLAGTVETWWPAIEAYLRLRVTNARTEGYNRKIKQIKQIKRVACGFCNQASYERRILLNNAATAA